MNSIKFIFYTFIYLLFSLLFITSGITVVSQSNEDTTSPTPSPEAEASTSNDIKEKINDLKERLATKVAELKEEKKRSFYGIIKETSENTMTLLYKEEEKPIAVIDSTRFFSLSSSRKRSEAKKDDFQAGDTAVVFGTLDIDDKTILASYLYKLQLPILNRGIVQSIDENDGSFTIQSDTGTLTIDYEISSKCYTVTNFEKKTKKQCGLSQIKKNDYVFLRLKPNEKDLSRATVIRMLLYHPEPADDHQNQ